MLLLFVANLVNWVQKLALNELLRPVLCRVLTSESTIVLRPEVLRSPITTVTLTGCMGFMARKLELGQVDMVLRPKQSAQIQLPPVEVQVLVVSAVLPSTVTLPRGPARLPSTTIRLSWPRTGSINSKSPTRVDELTSLETDAPPTPIGKESVIMSILAIRRRLGGKRKLKVRTSPPSGII